MRGLRTSVLASSLVLACAAVGCAGTPRCPDTAATPPAAAPDAASIGAPAAGEPRRLETSTAFLARVNVELKKLQAASERASWVNDNFITDDTEAIAAAADEAVMAYMSRTVKEAGAVGPGATPDEARMLKRLRVANTLPAPSSPEAREELAKLGVQMSSLYGKGKYCPKGTPLAKKLPKAKDGKVEPCFAIGELSDVLANSRDEAELREAWMGWHAIAPPLRPLYERFVELGNQGAKEIGFADLGALWRSNYDLSPEAFEADTDRLWSEVKPLYDELHCYVRSKLRGKYPSAKIGDKAPIPAHLLGNMWAQEWQNVYPLAEPYAGQPSLDVTKALVAKKYDAKKLVRLGESFFTSLGLDPLPKSFWERSLFEKPADRDVVCHASAWDVAYSDDLRIKMCIKTNEEDLVTIHHELGHVYYYHAYHELPILFQDGANDGFHEGIGDTLALSVTPAYLKGLGILDNVPANEKGQINYLFKQALDKVAFLPFGKLIDQWRWDVFAGKVPPSKYNEAWWALRLKYQGVAPPEARSEKDFDPGAKYHVPANTPYTRYFLARIYQFQFHRALCQAAGHKGPLHTCSIYGSKEAGQKLQAMLALGASKPWPEAMKAITGQDRGDATAMLEYFAPLREWLKAQNAKESCGW